MKKTIFTLALIMYSAKSPAAALSSIYSGEQYQIPGQVLVQDANDPNKFYFLPQSYRVKRKVTVDMEHDMKRTVKYAVTNHVTPSGPGGARVSTYTIALEMDVPGRKALDRATELLRTKSGNFDAEIAGIAPICGVRIDVPGFSQSAQANGVAAIPAGATSIRYSFASTEEGKCNFIGSAAEFNVEYSVPFEKEPMAADNLTSGAGLSLPPINLVLPYKYKDVVSVSFNARNALHQLKMGGDVQGSFKFVSAQLTANISSLFTNLQMMGQLHRKCENPDPAICDQYMEMAKEMALKSFYAILPSKDNPQGGDTNPLVVADKDKALSVVSAHLAFDEQNVEKDFNFEFNLTNDVFSSIRTQAQLDVRNIGEDVLDPDVLKLLQAKRSGQIPVAPQN